MEQARIERQLRLLLLLTENVRYTICDLANMLRLHKRTIYRYINCFREAGFVVKHTGTVYSLGKDSAFFRRICHMIHLTEDEASIISVLLNYLDAKNPMRLNIAHKLYEMTRGASPLSGLHIRKQLAQNVNLLCDSINNRQQVLLRNYCSYVNSQIHNRYVEPFAFVNDYIGVWCYDIEMRCNILFRISRISDVDILDRDWEYEEYHEEGFMDIFYFSGTEQHRVQLKLGMQSYFSLLEEFPLSEKYLKQIDELHWLLDTCVCAWRGVGRFVIGLIDDIEILDTPELDEYVRQFLNRG